MDEEIILFDISQLMAGCVKDKLNSFLTLKEKIKYLISVIDFYTSSDFTEIEKNEINEFYYDYTAERYEAPYLDLDTKNLIIEFTVAINSFEKGVELLNQCCNEYQKDEAISKAKKVIELIDLKQNRKIIENICFIDNDNADESVNSKPLDVLLKNAKEKAKQMNNN